MSGGAGAEVGRSLLSQPLGSQVPRQTPEHLCRHLTAASSLERPLVSSRGAAAGEVLKPRESWRVLPSNAVTQFSIFQLSEDNRGGKASSDFTLLPRGL